MSSVDQNRPRDYSRPGPLSGICVNGPKHGHLHATLDGRRTPMEGGAYLYRPDPGGHHVGTWVWLADKEKT